MEYWLVVSRKELIGADGKEKYTNRPTSVTASSDSDQPYKGLLSLQDFIDCFKKF